MREIHAWPTFNIFYNAPALMIICATTEDQMALKDCCLAAQKFMLAAHAARIGFGPTAVPVMAASDADDPAEVKTVRPSRPDSYEALCHDTGVNRLVVDHCTTTCANLGWNATSAWSTDLTPSECVTTPVPVCLSNTTASSGSIRDLRGDAHTYTNPVGRG